ncbi:MAG: hypothetical protein IPH57_01200 [Saprospiraceae bacterium]|nr:hypothetical protein [Saprospiraceae bacterium]
MSKTVKRISAKDLLQLIESYKKENCVVIDARDGNKYLLGHIPGAVSVDPSIKNSHLKLLNYLKKKLFSFTADLVSEPSQLSRN